MTGPRPPDFPATALRALLEWWAATRTRGVIIGGVAVGLVATPRFTHDIDATIITDEDELETFLAAGERFGFVPRIEHPVEFAHRARILLLYHEPTQLAADVALAGFGFEVEMVTGARRVDVGGLEIPLPRPEELVVMKAVAHRDQDLLDIAAVLDTHPETDLDEVRRTLAELEAISDDSAPIAALDRLLSERRRRQAD